MTTKSKTVNHVLLIEDDTMDAELIQNALAGTAIPHELHVVRDGLDALDYLERRAPFQNEPRPNLVLLDLTVPQQSGFAVLEQLKRDPALRTIPTVVLTGSQQDKDVWRSYQLHANAYMVKPTDTRDFSVALGRLAEFYLQVAQLPPSSPPRSQPGN